MTRARARCTERLLMILTITSIFVVLIYDRSSFREKVILKPHPSKMDWENFELDTDMLSKNLLMDYISWTNQTSCQRPHSMGGKTDHSIVCLDPPAVPQNPCSVYSFDFFHDWYFENAMKDSNCNVYSFDPATLGMKLENWTGRDDFVGMQLPDSKGNSRKNDVNNRRKYRGKMPKMFESIFRVMERLLDEEKDDYIVDYLKLDIEGEEWDVIPMMLKYKMFTQIRQFGVEIHLFKDDVEYYQDIARKIRALEKAGMVRFHSKETPCSYSGLQAKWPEDRKIVSPIKCFEMAWYQVIP